ncbi:uncharacterized protein LAESUDRAFT_354325 [Laetiporus sulphureus 93-53]|uniref:Uncharacterized protein n=1 Tax=Laetiporus sulphureus 93-53 TaxID=1314785 RepID=A0A165GVX4_9APHY|nr:uncharacterized protein LAESUDRAFT_354325 [Laetiporus sulphureus 93-53]KZT10896.1 hypothetical protein LAESUDRAFT_354325 [Laetiporus sulphureus 93-53]
MGGNIKQGSLRLTSSAPAIHPPSLVWAKSHARIRALHHWRRDWRKDAHPSPFRAAVTAEPSLTLHRYFRENDDTRQVECRLVHLLTGHGHVGSYYNRFVHEESIACQCRTANMQTRDHLLIDCTSYPSSTPPQTPPPYPPQSCALPFQRCLVRPGRFPSR